MTLKASWPDVAYIISYLSTVCMYERCIEPNIEVYARKIFGSAKMTPEQKLETTQNGLHISDKVFAAEKLPKYQCCKTFLL